VKLRIRNVSGILLHILSTDTKEEERIAGTVLSRVGKLYTDKGNGAIWREFEEKIAKKI